MPPDPLRGGPWSVENPIQIYSSGRTSPYSSTKMSCTMENLLMKLITILSTTFITLPKIFHLFFYVFPNFYTGINFSYKCTKLTNTIHKTNQAITC